jgi:hypothetical protein
MVKSLHPKLIIKSIVQTIVAELQQIKRLWKSIMKKKQLGLVKKDYVSPATQA